MKAFITATMITVLLLSFFGCTSKQSDQLTEEQKAQIKGELKSVFDSFCVKWVALDKEAILQFYSPEMNRIGSSKLLDFQGEKNLWDGINSAVSLKIEPVYLELKVLTKDFGISAWVGKTDYVMKSGDTLKVDKVAYTNVWGKNNGQWKIIYEHASQFK